jgi:hypothetical protein
MDIENTLAPSPALELVLGSRGSQRLRRRWSRSGRQSRSRRFCTLCRLSRLRNLFLGDINLHHIISRLCWPPLVLKPISKLRSHPLSHKIFGPQGLLRLQGVIAFAKVVAISCHTGFGRLTAHAQTALCAWLAESPVAELIGVTVGSFEARLASASVLGIVAIFTDGPHVERGVKLA